MTMFLQLLHLRKNFSATCFIFFFTNILLSQMITTADGMEIGDRKAFINACTAEAEKKTMEFKGIKVLADNYCSCMADQLLPSIQSSDFLEASVNGSLETFLTNEENLPILMHCLEGNFSMDSNFVFQENNTSSMALSKKIAIDQCIKEVLNSPETQDFWTKESTKIYCTCAIERLYNSGLSYDKIKDMENIDSQAFNEIAIPCINEALATSDFIKPSNTYRSEDIIGKKKNSAVPLIDYINQGYKIKVSIDGITRYFLFDTGASDLIINKTFEQELLKKGALDESRYLGQSTYLTANSEELVANMVILDNIIVGDYTLNNTVIAIIEDSALLFGKGILDKFSKWEIDTNKKELILYR